MQKNKILVRRRDGNSSCPSPRRAHSRKNIGTQNFSFRIAAASADPLAVQWGLDMAAPGVSENSSKLELIGQSPYAYWRRPTCAPALRLAPRVAAQAVPGRYGGVARALGTTSPGCGSPSTERGSSPRRKIDTIGAPFSNTTGEQPAPDHQRPTTRTTTNEQHPPHLAAKKRRLRAEEEAARGLKEPSASAFDKIMGHVVMKSSIGAGLRTGKHIPMQLLCPKEVRASYVTSPALEEAKQAEEVRTGSEYATPCVLCRYGGVARALGATSPRSPSGAQPRISCWSGRGGAWSRWSTPRSSDVVHSSGVRPTSEEPWRGCGSPSTGRG